MSILYRPEERILTLHTRHTTYQMQIDAYGFLRHLYYGARVDDHADFRYLYHNYDRGFSGNPPECRYDRSFSLDTMPQEYAGFGGGDFRVYPLCAVHADGSYAADWRYLRHEILSDKYSLPGLPAAFDRDGGAMSLVVTLQDPVTLLQARLYYGVFEQEDVITRAVEIVNGGTSDVYLEKAASVCLDIPFGTWEVLHFHGRHCMERQPERVPLGHGTQSVESRRGMSSHHHNPFVILCAPDAHEDSGECYGFMPLWSGNHKTELEADYLGSVRVVSGVHDSQFRWHLEPGGCFFAPEVLLSYTNRGFADLTHHYHNMIRGHVCRSPYVHKPRPVLFNSWEATFMDFDTQKLLHAAEQAAALGVELFVMDDGWFGARNDDNAGLGDWFVNEQKLPGGLAPLIQGVKNLGMKFGIWIEPEMVNEDSDLYRRHPEWALAAPNRQPMFCRNQLVLDLSRQDVRDYLYDCFSALLRAHDISYVKWDMNRPVSDVYSNALPPERQGETMYRYVLGVYDLLERLTAAFPDVIFEGCAGGGGRFDAGILQYCPQIWCSDDTDAIERLDIQHGTSFGYPVSTMGAHVSACPNQQTGRTVSLFTRGVVAMSGTFGYELDLNNLSDAEKDEIRQQIKTFKKLQCLIQDGDYYRLNEMEAQTLYSAWEFASPDGAEALVNLVVKRKQVNAPLIHVRLKGLTPDAMYRLDGDPSGVQYSGAALMYGGYTFPLFPGDYPSAQARFLRVDNPA